jgi:bacillithiol system protein YtxJ
VALQRLQKAKQPEGIDFHFLDLLAHRPLSNKVAEVFQVHHESPQVLVIKDGKCVFDESHLGISMNDIVAEATMA